MFGATRHSVKGVTASYSRRQHYYVRDFVSLLKILIRLTKETSLLCNGPLIKWMPEQRDTQNYVSQSYNNRVILWTVGVSPSYIHTQMKWNMQKAHKVGGAAEGSPLCPWTRQSKHPLMQQDCSVRGPKGTLAGWLGTGVSAFLGHHQTNQTLRLEEIFHT